VEPNRYLVSSSGRSLRGARWVVGLWVIACVLLLPVIVGSALLWDGAGGPALTGVGLAGVGLGVAMLLGLGVAGAVALGRSEDATPHARRAWLAGDDVGAIAACHRALSFAPNRGVRAEALHVLGLCAEGRGDLAEAVDLYDLALAASRGMTPWARPYLRLLVQSHRALALVGLGRVAEAEAAVRDASAIFATLRGPIAAMPIGSGGSGDARGVIAAIEELEPGRDPRALLALATAAVLLAARRSREAFEVVEREGLASAPGLLPRERQLGARLQLRARAELAPAAVPLRAPAAPEDADAAWAAHLLRAYGT
jgi:tetratricopeptide (TPR) repeat protein